MEPKRFKLDTKSSFIDPFWYRSNSGKEIETEVRADGSIQCNGEQLVFCAERLPSGTMVLVEIGRWITCVDANEARIYRAHVQQVADERRAESEMIQRLTSNQRRQEADDFNRRLCLPVQWHISHKDVLSGLSERSFGNGMNKATVLHINLLEDLTDKKLVRKKGDYLCTTTGGSNGKNWSGCNSDPIFHRDGEGNSYIPKVTCKACLKYASRYLT